MTLTKQEFAALQLAGFTRRQIDTMQQKFHNLFNIAPLPMPHSNLLKRSTERTTMTPEEQVGQAAMSGFAQYEKELAALREQNLALEQFAANKGQLLQGNEMTNAYNAMAAARSGE